jgi:hypothetical protein
VVAAALARLENGALRRLLLHLVASRPMLLRISWRPAVSRLLRFRRSAEIRYGSAWTGKQKKLCSQQCQ